MFIVDFFLVFSYKLYYTIFRRKYFIKSHVLFLFLHINEKSASSRRNNLTGDHHFVILRVYESEENLVIKKTMIKRWLAMRTKAICLMQYKKEPETSTSFDVSNHFIRQWEMGRNSDSCHMSDFVNDRGQ